MHYNLFSVKTGHLRNVHWAYHLHILFLQVFLNTQTHSLSLTHTHTHINTQTHSLTFSNKLWNRHILIFSLTLTLKYTNVHTHTRPEILTLILVLSGPFIQREVIEKIRTKFIFKCYYDSFSKNLICIPLKRQFHQHFTSSFLAENLSPKKIQSQTVTREKLKTLSYKKSLL